MSSGRVEVSYHAVVQGGSEKMMMMIMRRRYGGWDVIVDRGRMRCFFTGAPPILFLNTRNSIVPGTGTGRFSKHARMYIHQYSCCSLHSQQ